MYFHGVRSRVDVWHGVADREHKTASETDQFGKALYSKMEEADRKVVDDSVSSPKSVAFPALSLRLPGCSANRL